MRVANSLAEVLIFLGLWVAVVKVSLLGFWRLVCGLWCTFEHHVNRFGVRMSIFLRLREERERLGFSQEAFGALGGVQKRAQINYEKGERHPDSAYLAAIAAAGADVLYILTGQRTGGVKPAPTLTAEEETMLGYFRDASKEVRRAALGALLGASVQTASHVGGTHSQHSSGPGAIHIGGVGKTLPKRRG